MADSGGSEALRLLTGRYPPDAIRATGASQLVAVRRSFSSLLEFMYENLI